MTRNFFVSTILALCLGLTETKLNNDSSLKSVPVGDSADRDIIINGMEMSSQNSGSNAFCKEYPRLSLCQLRITLDKAINEIDFLINGIESAGEAARDLYEQDGRPEFNLAQQLDPSGMIRVAPEKRKAPASASMFGRYTSGRYHRFHNSGVVSPATDRRLYRLFRPLDIKQDWTGQKSSDKVAVPYADENPSATATEQIRSVLLRKLHKLY